MKRQNSQLSSTSRRDPPPENLRAKSIGCMSGIIHLLSKYQNRHKKLTFGKSKEKDIIVFSSSSPSDQSLVSTAGISPATPPPRGQRRSRSDKEGKRTTTTTDVVDFNRRKMSSDLPTRSPTLSAEIRRSSSVKSSETIGKSPALVARLMGLEAAPATPAKEIASSEKRRKLLGALEKCDNDLKALKDIIMAFRSPESHSPATAMDRKCLNQEKVRTISGRECRDYCDCGDGEKQQQEQTSAASVLNESGRLHLDRINRTTRGRENGRQEVQQQQPKKKNPAAIEDDPITKLQERIKKLQQISSIIQLETKPRTTTATLLKKKKENDNDPPLTWRKKAMAESLEEISNEISWGFKQEMAKIGMVLQHHIYRDLIDEMVTDMAFSSSASFLPFHSYSYSSPPPFEACRRRLRF